MVAVLAVAIFAGVEVDYEDEDVRFDVKNVCFSDMEGAWTRSVSLHRLVKKASTLMQNLCEWAVITLPVCQGHRPPTLVPSRSLECANVDIHS